MITGVVNPFTVIRIKRVIEVFSHSKHLHAYATPAKTDQCMLLVAVHFNLHVIGAMAELG